jgi:alpha-beta hydrolase superfamily lysophospholipase
MRITTHDGLQLEAHVWTPPEPRGQVLIVHGICEHGGRYANVVEPLNAAGWEVWALDHRGHGSSPGRRGHITAWSDYRNDLSAYVRTAVAQRAHGKTFLFAHSMGALIAVEWFIESAPGTKDIAGAIIEGLPIQPGEVASPAKVTAAKVMSRLIPTFTLPFSKNRDGLSTDPSVARAFDADPLTHNKVTARWGVEILDAIDRVKTSPARFTAPALFVHGADDPLNLIAGVQEWLPNVGSTDKRLQMYPGNRHEVHNDLARATLMGDVTEWLDQHST